MSEGKLDSEVVNNKEARLETWMEAADFIAEVPPGCKLSIRTREYHRANSYMDAFYRFWSRFESKDETANFVESILCQGQALMKEFPDTRPKIIAKLVRISRGTLNLANVYVCHPRITQQLKRLIARMKEIINQELDRTEA